MNVLFLGAGKRVTMASIFKDSGFFIFSYEIEQDVPISKIAKIIQGKQWKDPNILDHIKEIVKQYDIKMIIPFQDAAIEVCSKLDLPIVLLCSGEKTAAICHNKKLLEQFMLEHFAEFYPTSEKNEEKIYKPIYGFGGRNIIKTHEDLILNNYICQKYIEGKEYSIDCYSDKTGMFVDGVCRLRLQVCCGEVIKSKTVLNNELLDLCRKISNKLEIKGPSNFQFIVDSNNNPYLIEINCRFGGGYTFAYKCGFDFINLIKADYFEAKRNYKAFSWKPNMILSRYYEDYIYEEQKNSN